MYVMSYSYSYTSIHNSTVLTIVSLAIAMASSVVLKVVTDATGPKISSWKTRILLCPLKIVGCT